METGLHRVRAELKRQLLLGKDDKLEGPGIVTIHDFGVEYPSSLKDLDQQLDDSIAANASLRDLSLLWKLCSLCGPSPCFLDAEFVRKRIQSFHKLPADPLRTYTDDIWRNPRLFSWLNDDTSSLLLVKGTFDSAARVAVFGAELADHIVQQEPLAYMACAPAIQSRFQLPFRLDAAQLLRHLAIQALLNLERPISAQFLIDTLKKFTSANSLEDWFKVVEGVVRMSSRLYIILHLGIQDVIKEVPDWPRHFQSILDRIPCSPDQSIVKVMIISCRPLEQPGTSSTISVQMPALPPEHIRALPKNRPVIPRNLMALRNANRNSKHDRPASSDDPASSSSDTIIPRTVSERPPDSSGAERTPSLPGRSTGCIKPKDRKDFGVAIFCALSREADAVISLLDHHWDRKEYGKGAYDPNSYTLGAFGPHNAVIVHLPGMGKGSAASAASSCHASFTGIRLALVVGICGGVPFGPGGTERILGDVAISDGLVQYDFGRQFPGQFIRKTAFHDSLSRPNAEVRGFLARLSGRQSRKALGEAMQTHLASLLNGNGPEYLVLYQNPGSSADVLYESSYLHKHREASLCKTWLQTCGMDRACDGAKGSSCETLECSRSRHVPRRRLPQPRATQSQDPVLPVVHIGTVACGDAVMKSGEERDRLARDEGIIAFEMEGAGVWEHFPCLIVKGICDYADCHKSKKWQDYATATAAACMKAILEQWD